MLIGHSVSDADGVILTMDGAVADLMHRSIAEVSGMSYVDLTHPDDVPMNLDRVGRLAVGVGPTRLRKRYIRPDGTSVLADVHISRFVTGSDVGRLVGTIYDVSGQVARPGPHRLWQAVRSADAMLRERRAILGEDIFGDHAWMVLMQVYLAEAEGRIAEIGAIGESIAIGRGRADRWIKALESKGLIERPHDPDDAVQLTTGGLATIEKLLESMLAH